MDDLVDVIEGNRIYIPCLYILNKIDQITLEELEVIDRMENYVPICAYHEWNLDGVLECVWDKLNLTRCAMQHSHDPAGTLTTPACLRFTGRGSSDAPGGESCMHVNRRRWVLLLRCAKHGGA